MYGVLIEEGISDWQILQHKNGEAKTSLRGSWSVPEAAVKVGVLLAEPVIRLISEEDNRILLPWAKARSVPAADGLSGEWSAELTVPAGGLYRIETGLDTRSTNPLYHWMFRGDVRLHIGAGNVFIVAGQSNSAGYGRDSGWDPPELGVHLYRNRRRWDLACHPINECTGAEAGGNSELGISGTSPYIAFGKSLRRATGYPVGLISCALGGSPISRWSRKREGDLFEAMLLKLTECGGDFAGVLWYQGCSDCNPENAPLYAESFRAVAEDLRGVLGYEIPFFTFQLNRMRGDSNDRFWGQVREAQRRAAKEIPGVYILPTLHCPMSDAIHNSSHANVLLGESLAKLCGEVLCHGAAFRAPELTSAILCEKTLRLSFENVALGFEGFGGKPEESFTVTDAQGEIALESWVFEENTILLTLSREAQGECLVSFGWQADPTAFPPQDTVTYLPPLSFFEVPVEMQNDIHSM